jgi:hypothetical protein
VEKEANTASGTTIEGVRAIDFSGPRV